MTPMGQMAFKSYKGEEKQPLSIEETVADGVPRVSHTVTALAAVAATVLVLGIGLVVAIVATTGAFNSETSLVNIIHSQNQLSQLPRG